MSGKVRLHLGRNWLLHRPMEKYVSKKMENLPLFYFAAPGPFTTPRSNYSALLTDTRLGRYTAWPYKVSAVLVEAQIFYNWSIDPVHSSICSSFTNGLKWQLDCIRSLLQNKGVHHCHPSPLPTTVAYYRHHHHHQHHRHHYHPLLLPITVIYHRHLSLLPTNPRYSLLVIAMGNSDG